MCYWKRNEQTPDREEKRGLAHNDREYSGGVGCLFIASLYVEEVSLGGGGGGFSSKIDFFRRLVERRFLSWDHPSIKSLYFTVVKTRTCPVLVRRIIIAQKRTRTGDIRHRCTKKKKEETKTSMYISSETHFIISIEHGRNSREVPRVIRRTDNTSYHQREREVSNTAAVEKRKTIGCLFIDRRENETIDFGLEVEISRTHPNIADTRLTTIRNKEEGEDRSNHRNEERENQCGIVVDREREKTRMRYDWLTLLRINNFLFAVAICLSEFYCHGIGCWALLPHILLSKEIFDWNGLYSMSWSLELPPVIDIDEKAWKKFDFSGMLLLLLYECMLLFGGRTMVEPDDDDEEDEDGGGDANPLLNIEFVRYWLLPGGCERWPTILRGGTPANCIGGGGAACWVGWEKFFVAACCMKCCCCCCWLYLCWVGRGGRLLFPFWFICWARVTSEVIISEIRSRFHQKSLLKRVIHALSSRKRYRSRSANRALRVRMKGFIELTSILKDAPVDIGITERWRCRLIRCKRIRRIDTEVTET